ncbi:MAG: hypothetical protein FWG34_09975 [Oscillospiraceae bacterium]|nr:hypothetical protein [Oscillospiraceae bacterium]
MDIVENIRLGIDCADGDAIQEARRISGKSSGISARIYKKSIDARHKNNIKFVYSVIFGEEKKENAIKIEYGKKPQKDRPTVIGFGPAGMFCALALAQNGYEPIIFEMGCEMGLRVEKVEKLFLEGILDEKTNVCFGEGGAGTFSDGKLTTRINDGYCRFILKKFVEFGAPEEIMYQAKPHIGTDKIRGMTKKIRGEITKNGGTIYFNSELTDIQKYADYVKFTVNKTETFKTSGMFLAAGQHSPELYGLFIKRGFTVVPKAYSVGFRIEHKQSYIDELVYGKYAGHKNLPPAEYVISHKKPDTRGVYTFCMCPGGVVVNSSTESGAIVTNGMSDSSRSKENANAAIAVSILPDDYGNDLKNAFEFRKSIEKSAFAIKNKDFLAPAQSLGDYIAGKTGNLQKSPIVPSYTGKVTEYDLNKIFPEFVNKTIKEGIMQFDGILRGYFDENAILTAPETRTSSAARILRDNIELFSVDCGQIYPCGEGAGYAGGIMSSAVDGIRCAVKYMEKWKGR